MGWDCSLVIGTIGEPSRSCHGEGHVRQSWFRIGCGGSLRGMETCTRARSDHGTRETRLASLVSKDRSYKPMAKASGGERESEGVVVCAGRRMFLAGGSPVGPAPSGVRSQQAGVTPRRAQKGAERLRVAELHGDGVRAPVRETAGISACCLSSDAGLGLGVLGSLCAGQGAHREVGSEGFEANRRAVAEIGEPVGQIQVIPSLHYGGEGSTWGAWAQQGVCGRHGGKGACVTPGGLVRSRSTGLGTWAYKPSGEVAGDAVREVGVTHGTREPGKNKSPGSVLLWGGGTATQKALFRGKGSRWAGRFGRWVG